MNGRELPRVGAPRPNWRSCPTRQARALGRRALRGQSPSWRHPPVEPARGPGLDEGGGRNQRGGRRAQRSSPDAQEKTSWRSAEASEQAFETRRVAWRETQSPWSGAMRAGRHPSPLMGSWQTLEWCASVKRPIEEATEQKMRLGQRGSPGGVTLPEAMRWPLRWPWAIAHRRRPQPRRRRRGPAEGAGFARVSQEGVCAFPRVAAPPPQVGSAWQRLPGASMMDGGRPGPGGLTRSSHGLGTGAGRPGPRCGLRGPRGAQKSKIPG